MAGFVTVPERDACRLRNATVPAALLTELPPNVSVSPDGLAVVDLTIRDARVAAVLAPAASPPADADVDLRHGQGWPCLIDVHTHPHKGHTWERAPNPDGTFAGAPA